MTKKQHQSKSYTIKNRSPHDRVVVVEHPFRPEFKLVSKVEPKERSQTVYRFEVKVAAGQTAKLEVAEEHRHEWMSGILACDPNVVRYLLECEVSNAEAKTALAKILAGNQAIAKTADQITDVQKQLQAIVKDQDRLRANLKEMPKDAAAYRRYLEKFDSQETAIEKLQAQVLGLTEQMRKEEQEWQGYLIELDIKATIQKSPPTRSPGASTTPRRN